MRLNLCCGSDIRPGHVNVDFRKTHPSIQQVDLSCIPWPFPDNSASEILLLDALEHFPYRQTTQILSECWRVLGENGTMVIQVPDGEHLTFALSKRGDYLCNKCGESMALLHREEARSHCPKCGTSADSIAEAAMMRLYGGQDYEGNFHQTCFTRSSLLAKAASCGFSVSTEEEHEHQYANWNLRYRFTKGDIWSTV